MTRILSDSEGSRCLPLVTLMPINTSRREDIRQSDNQTSESGIPESKGVQAPFGARVQGLAGAAPLEASGSAHRAGWFRGEYCMPPLAAYKIFIAAGTAAIHNPRA